MKLDLQSRIRPGAFQRLAVIAEGASKKAVKDFGTIYVRAMAASTPPHPVGSPASVLSSKKQADILAAQKRISQNIAGVDSPAEVQAFARPVPYANLTGAWLAVDPDTGRPAPRRGDFGFVVPTSWRKVRGQAVPESTPAQAYAGAVWRRGRMQPARWARRFVRAKELRDFIKMKQKHVGKLISGWAPAARVFATGKGIAPGFFASLGGKGFGRIFKNKKDCLCGLAINRQPYSPQQEADIRRRVPVVMRTSRKACEARLEHIKKWYIRNAKKALAAK